MPDCVFYITIEDAIIRQLHLMALVYRIELSIT